MFTVNAYDWTRPSQESLPGGTKRLYAYDPLMRVTDIVVQDPGENETLNYGYSYDKVNNITAKRTGRGDTTYDYDNLYRLTNALHPDQPAEAFDYDRVGNRTSAADTTGPLSYNANNELKIYGDVTFTYDANGNTIEKNANGVVTRFFYNLEDRLERVEDGSGSVIASYYYDPFGRRLWKEVGGARTYFHYNDEGLVGEYDGTGAEIKTYGWKPGATWSTDPQFMKQGAEYYWYHNDHLGTPQMMTTSSGAVVWKATYSSFGKVSVDPLSSVVNPFRFAGQYFDAETGLHYNLHRYYDPQLGKYLSADPIGFTGGINLFLYARGNPINAIDPNGLSVEVGGGFGFTVPGYHFNVTVSTDTCCDKNNRKHKRTIVTTCAGFSLGLEIGGGSGPGGGSFSWGGKMKSCKGKVGDDFYEDKGFGFSSALAGGASWDSDDPTRTTLTTGIGVSLHFWSRCNTVIKQDVNTGDCCNG